MTGLSATLSDQMINGQTIAQRIDHFRIIGKKSGKYILPVISIPWWNSQTEKFEHVQLNAQKIIVNKSNTITANKVKLKSQTDKASNNNLNFPEKQLINENLITSSSIIFYITIILLLIVLIMLINIFKVPRQIKRFLQFQYIKFTLINACKHNNAVKTREILLFWSQIYLLNTYAPQLISIAQLTSDAQIKKTIFELDSLFYGNNKQHWDGKVAIVFLLKLIKNYSIKTINATKNLDDLWP